MKCLVPYIACILFACSANAQNTAWNRHSVDSAVLSWSLTDIHDADDLADTLTSIFTTDSDKVRAIYFWITQYIRYDLEKFHDNRDILYEAKGYIDKDGNLKKDKEIKHTLYAKKGICHDYAELFGYMCNHENIKCESIIGYGASLCTGWLMGLDMGNDHEWNAVMINNKWYLLDVTWASGYIEGKTFHRQRNDCYYLTPPKDFIKDHFPEDSQWQLLQPTIDKKTFLALNKEKRRNN